MYWRIYGKETPPNLEDCIVGRVYKGKVQTGVFTYHYSGSESYWEDKTGYTVKCDRRDNWCPVQSVVNGVAEKIEEDLSWELEKMKMNCGYF